MGVFNNRLVSHRRLKALIAVLSLATAFLLAAAPANAIPSFAQQTGQPCQACHVGAFGPQLKPYGRDFKLFGYLSSDDASHVPPIAATVQSSFTHTNAAQNPPPAAHFADNDNFAVDQVSLYYGGKAPLGFGMFAQVTYDGVARAFNLDNVDIRRASQFTLFGKDSVAGFDFNNNPTVEDPWNSTPAWGFPYNGSALAPGQAASTLIDGQLGGQVTGAGGYLLWNDTIYVYAAAYAPLNRVFAGRLGEGTNSTSDRYSGVIPYGRIALVHDVGGAPTQTMEVGAYAISAARYPGGDVTAGTDRLTDWALDANYQYFGWKHQEVSAHATYIHEDQDLKASSILSGTRPTNRLATVRADVSYSYKDTWTPSLQTFTTTGTADPVLYPTGLRTSGYVAELALTPWGKPDSPIYWANARFAVQYVAYTEFNGARHGASDNNTLFLNVWIALAPFGSQVHR